MQVVKDIPWIAPFQHQLEERRNRFEEAKNRIVSSFGSMDAFTDSYKTYGVHHIGNGILYKEWAPNARQLFLMGDFNDWERSGNIYEAQRDQYGTFTLWIPDTANGPVIPHNSKIKCRLVLYSGETLWRIPAWVNYLHQNPNNFQFDGLFWNPPQPYVFRNPLPVNPPESGLLIYETHIGMAGLDPRIHTYAEFERDMLPMIAGLGYNAIQVMAVMEHAYYASFGYQVTNFFAISSRFGSPEELKSLIDKAHSLGIRVFLDLIHSHASKNVDDGINHFDGTDHQYFHGGGRGYHPQWDSRLFNYNNIEVQRFLLSNLKYYLAEYRFDGFRFDGVTSIVYRGHGFDGVNSLDDFFNWKVDDEAMTYLLLANDVIHSFRPDAVSIAEEWTGMFGLARSIADGGIGFDYRLGMGTPDLWIKTLKEVSDENWDMWKIAQTISNRPYKEKTIAYCECHDQALVGDKTIAFWLMDKEMYWFMSTLSPQSSIIDRGIALHKMIRLITFGLGGEAYLNFMGNEFGHPEWIDFPRAGNGNSFHHCRRRFDLPKDNLLKYKFLLNFDKEMVNLELKYKFMKAGEGYIILHHEDDKIIAFERGDLLFVLNFHVNKSFSDYFIGVEHPGNYKMVLCTDDEQFGGFKRLDANVIHTSVPGPYMNRANKIQLYIPNRCAFVLRREQ